MIKDRILSIVTVVKDDLEGFKRTLNSIETSVSKNQTLGLAFQFEWIVVDSSLNQNLIQNVLERQDLKYSYMWTNPEGVYPAMNKAAEISHGEYLYFLNAGDEFYSEASLPTIIELCKKGHEWFYGGVAFLNKSGLVIIPEPFDYQSELRCHFGRGRFPPHQGTVVSKSLFEKLGGFNTSYKIVADYVMVLKLSQLSEPKEVDSILALFPMNGISNYKWRDSLKEFHRARIETFKLDGFSGTVERGRYVFQLFKTLLAKTFHRI